MKIAIVIINWNGKHLLNKYIQNIIDCSDDSVLYVIDNNSSDGTVVFLKNNFKKVNIIKLEKNYGFAEGYNIGLKKIKEEFVCLLNNDIKVTKNWLKPIRAHLKQNPKSIIQPTIMDINNNQYYEYAGAAGGFIDKYGYAYCRGRIFETIERNKNNYKNCEVFWASGACLIISKSEFYNLGGFDKRFFAHMEEIDFCWRAFNQGYKSYCLSESLVYHEGSATIKKNSRKTYLNYRNSLLMLTKNLPIKNLIGTLIVRLLMDILSSLRFIINGEISHFYSVYKAHLDYYIMLKKVLSDRDNSMKKSNYFKINSIVYQYFILGKKKFFQL
tara:strand:+ start:18984 stop:19967 length:984 start_codon:yes stop_codon:yes gene_type:complete